MPSIERSAPSDVAIIGGGVIGLASAWRLAQDGASVSVFERGRTGRGASHAAAGMLAACAEAEPGERALVALNRAGQAMWPDFAQQLREASGVDVELRTEGTLVVALNADDQARLRHQHALQSELGLPVEWLAGAELRRREPCLSTRACGALWCGQDHQVDNRKLAEALRIAAECAGVTIREEMPVERIAVESNRAVGVLVAGELHRFGHVVVAAGPWSRQVDTLLPVRPIKGQAMSLRMDPTAPLLTHVMWAPGCYLVPRRDGRLLLGATVEEKGFDTTVTAGGVLSLLEAAWRVLPGIEELPIEETWVGHRPGSRDDAPILGAGPVAGLTYATGHHRNGILLTPLTAEAVHRSVSGERQDELVEAFAFDRFRLTAAAE